jgi:F0F1-type ATP synthase membrane subunit a
LVFGDKASLQPLLFSVQLAQTDSCRLIVLELLVTGISQQIEDVIRKDARPYLPLLGTLFIFLVTANLSGVLPGNRRSMDRGE